MTRERSGSATVVSQEGTQLRVSYRDQQLTARMLGFPPGFKLRPGERVILADEPSGLTARPLVRVIRRGVRREALERDRQADLAGEQVAMQEGTAVALEPEQAPRRPDWATIWIVEPGDAKGPQQVIAARWPRG